MSGRNRLLRERQRAGLSCHLLKDLPDEKLERALRSAGFLTVLDPSHDDVTAALTRAVFALIEDET